MPPGLLPAPGMFSDRREIPVCWNQKRITLEQADPASGAPRQQLNRHHADRVLSGPAHAAGRPLVGVAAAGTPAGVPGPGGKDSAKKAGALAFWMTPAQIQHLARHEDRCLVCHGNGPILASRRINDGDACRGRSDTDREIAYGHPAKLFDNPLFEDARPSLRAALRLTKGPSHAGGATRGAA